MRAYVTTFPLGIRASSAWVTCPYLDTEYVDVRSNIVSYHQQVHYRIISSNRLTEKCHLELKVGFIFERWERREVWRVRTLY